MNLITLIRYRFFFFAGFLPYLLGQAIAFGLQKQLNWQYFWLGFVGISLVLAAVELFNEYFDAKEGGDRIFSKEQLEIPGWFFKLGLLACAIAFVIGIYLFSQTGWLVLLFCVLGFCYTFCHCNHLSIQTHHAIWGCPGAVIAAGPYRAFRNSRHRDNAFHKFQPR